MTEPEMRAQAVSIIQAMEAGEPAPQAEQPEQATTEDVDSAEGGEVAQDGVEQDNPDSQDQDAEGTEGQAEGEEGQDQAAEAVEAPEFWPSEAKADFAGLGAEAQEALLKHYKTAQTQINAKFEEAAAVRKSAEAEVASLKAFSEHATSVVEAAQKAFGDKWAGVTDGDWLALAQQNPQEYTRLKAQYDAEQSALQQANAAKEAAAQVERQTWLNEQAEALKTLAPDLVDPKLGRSRAEKTLAYLKTRGASEQDLNDVSAAVLALAYDSMQLRELRANPAKATPKPAPRAGLPATGSRAPAPSQERNVQQLKNSLAQTGDRGTAVAMLQAQGLL